MSDFQIFLGIAVPLVAFNSKGLALMILFPFIPGRILPFCRLLHSSFVTMDETNADEFWTYCDILADEERD